MESRNIGIVTRIDEKYLYVWNIELGIKEVRFMRDDDHRFIEVNLFFYCFKKI